MENTPGVTTANSGKKGRGLLWSILAVVLAFGAGFGWQYYEASQVREELVDTRRQLMVERLRVRLGQAAMAAQVGNYESARQRMSSFFTELDAAAPTLPAPLDAIAAQIMARRDDVITGLSRANPEYADVLYGMLDRFRSAAGLQDQIRPEPVAPEPGPEPVEGPDTAEPQGAADMTGATGDSAGG
jgi:hypothetical protein